MEQTIRKKQLRATILSYFPILVVSLALVVTLLWPLIFARPATAVSMRNNTGATSHSVNHV